MSWKEQLSKFYGVMFECGDYEALQKFISTQIIEKLIEEIPEGFPHPSENTILKQQLRAKWLSK